MLARARIDTEGSWLEKVGWVSEEVAVQIKVVLQNRMLYLFERASTKSGYVDESEGRKWGFDADGHGARRGWSWTSVMICGGSLLGADAGDFLIDCGFWEWVIG